LADPKEIMALLVREQRRLYGYVLTLLADSAAADDVLQETSLVILRKADEFERGANFAAWSKKIAYFQVLAYVKTKSRDRLRFAPERELVERISEAFLERQPVLDERLTALRICIRKLNEVDRDLIQRRYAEGADIATIAVAVGRSRQAIKQALYRIRGNLMQCIEQTLNREHC
jgi:RNA polymerase sigma-70 factor (ECF subfamily)